MSQPRRMVRFFFAALLAMSSLVLPAAVGLDAASAAPAWAPAATAPIRPGVQTVTGGGQCTANFVFYDASNNVYIGQAAHCSSTSGSTETNGCLARSLPLGTPVEISGASRPGTIVYNSWLTMQSQSPALDPDSETCQYNDLAIVKLDPADYGKVNPTIPRWGGPVGTNTAGTTSGETVYTYGNSSLRFGVSQTSPKKGTSLGTSPEGWSHTVYTATPGIPGDSGSAFLDKNGRALGVLSTVAIAPLAGSNGVGDFNKEFQYLLSHGGPQLTLATGTAPFTP